MTYFSMCQVDIKLSSTGTMISLLGSLTLVTAVAKQSFHFGNCVAVAGILLIYKQCYRLVTAHELSLGHHPYLG